ncbi:MAG: hypothetical protein EPN91_05610 [Salinibacterium sp.]|nr:MAG: hypothetical protein EPN91_05610 [Salinibacterium sp.]
MMSENVVALPGYSVPTTEAIPEVVAILEEYLAKAREGKVVGVAVVTAERDPAAFDSAYHASDHKHTLAAGIMALHWKIASRMAE